MIASDSELYTRARENEFKHYKGTFVGIVRPYDEQYEFLVRDMRRECPTIHGVRVDFPKAIVAVTKLLDALQSEHR